MISLLVSGGTLEERKEWVSQKTAANIYNLEIGGEGESVSIEDIRKLQKNLGLAVTDQKTRTCVLWEVQNLSLPAQQALLKLIEEPPENTQIILTADNANLLPATILSRCLNKTLPTQIAQLTQADETEIKEYLQILSVQSYANILKLAEKVTKSQDPKMTLVKILFFVRSGLLKQPSLKRAQVIKYLQEGILDLGTNINPQMAIEHCFLNIRQLNDKR